MADVNETDAEIVKAVEEHYDKNPDRAYYASELGKQMRAKGLYLPPAVTVVSYVRSQLENKILVVQDPNVPARIALALPRNREEIAQLISRRGVVAEAPEIEFSRLPHALIAAFCRNPTEGMKVFFRTIPPFRYKVASETPTEDDLEIEESFRPIDLRGVDVHQLSESQRLTAYKAIAHWARSNGLNLASLYLPPRGAVGRPGPTQSATPNALARLIAAQDYDLKTRIRIPLDIAELLANIP